MNRLNLPQRIVLVIGWGAMLWFFGLWVTGIGTAFGWVAYAPLSNTFAGPGGLHPWVRLLIWLVLVVVWMAGAMWLLRTRLAAQNKPD